MSRSLHSPFAQHAPPCLCPLAFLTRLVSLRATPLSSVVYATYVRHSVCVQMSADECTGEAEGEGEIFFTIPSLDELQQCVEDESAPIAKRMRSCFLLKQVGGVDAVRALSGALYSPSTLLGHEVAYVLGQMADVSAAPLLTAALLDRSIHPIVRHECAEALANIDLDQSLPLLEALQHDPCIEVADTAAIAVEKMRTRRGKGTARLEGEVEGQGEGAVAETVAAAPVSKFASLDPAPPLASSSVPHLQSVLCDSSLSMYTRYRAMFSLRNVGSEEAIAALSSSLSSSPSPVFRHEVAYVLGQIAHPAALSALRALLADTSEHAMVRHEAAEAIGSIAEEDSEEWLLPYLHSDSEDVIVKESCHVALDLAEYWHSDEVSTAIREEEEGNDSRPRGQEGARARPNLDDIPVTAARPASRS